MSTIIGRHSGFDGLSITLLSYIFFSQFGCVLLSPPKAGKAIRKDLFDNISNTHQDRENFSHKKRAHGKFRERTIFFI